MIDYFKKVVFENYANFNGRASRSEYWYFTLMHILILITVAVFESLIGMNYFVIYSICSLLLMIPSLAVGVRRLHDAGKSGWFVLINFIPLIGFIWFLVVLCKKSEEGSNKFGPNPFATGNELDLLGTE